MKMKNLFLEKECGVGDECFGSLEDQMSAFFSGSYDESHLSNIKDEDEDGGASRDERAAFWQAQEDMLKVGFFLMKKRVYQFLYFLFEQPQDFLKIVL